MRILPSQLIIMLLLYMGKANERELNHSSDEVYRRDMYHLMKEGLIAWDGTVHLTPKGTQRIMDFILDEPNGEPRAKSR